MGISRSAATVSGNIHSDTVLTDLSVQVVAYAMKEYKMSLNEAISYVKGKRAIVNPNAGFLTQLQAYEGILKAR